MIKNVFITGGLGQDGQILTKLLDKKKLNIKVITKQISKNIKKNNFIFNDLSNKKKNRSYFLKN